MGWKRFAKGNVVQKSVAKVVIFFVTTKKTTTFFTFLSFLLLQRDKHAES